MQNTGEDWDNSMSHWKGHGPEDSCSALGSAAEQLCLSEQVPPSTRGLRFCSQWLMLPKGQSGQGTTTECLREACGKVNGHCFQLRMLGALLMHTSCASVTFWSISAGVDLSLSVISSVSLSTTVRFWLTESQLFSKDSILPALCKPYGWHKMPLTFLSSLIFVLDSCL